MLLSEFRDDFTLQLTQANQKIQQLTGELQQLQQQALKLSGAIEAVDLIEQNCGEPVATPVVELVSDFEEASVLDVEVAPVKRTTKK
jgi:hypothetical protein